MMDVSECIGISKVENTPEEARQNHLLNALRWPPGALRSQPECDNVPDLARVFGPIRFGEILIINRISQVNPVSYICFRA